MKVIDKTNKSKEWDYGTVLKCWDDDPKKYFLYKIGKPHSTDPGDSYELDTLYNPGANERLWSSFFYDNVMDIKEELEDGFDHVVPVKATITIEDL